MNLDHTMIHLSLSDLGWLDGRPDDHNDRCAHGRVCLEVDGTFLMRPEDGAWTVSASALFLLRTLTDDHTPDEPVAEASQLFPCCGFNVAEGSDRYPGLCFGCPTGIDVWVQHADGQVTLTRGNLQATIPFRDWVRAVHAFADDVTRLYAESAPKAAPDNAAEANAWATFWTEWRSLRTAPKD